MSPADLRELTIKNMVKICPECKPESEIMEEIDEEELDDVEEDSSSQRE